MMEQNRNDLERIATALERIADNLDTLTGKLTAKRGGNCDVDVFEAVTAYCVNSITNQ